MQSEQPIVQEITIRQKETENLITLFSGILDHATYLAFPNKHSLTVSKVDQSNWKKIRRIVYYFSLPTFSKLKGISSLGIFFLWLFSFSIWSRLFLELLTLLLELELPSSEPVSVSLYETFMIFVFALGYIICTPLSYWSWVEFLRDKRFRIKWKFALILIYLGFTVAIILYIFSLMTNNERVIFLKSAIDPSNTSVVLFLLFGSLLPLTSYLTFVGSEFLVFLIGRIEIIFRFIYSSHNPWNPEIIRRLISEPILIEQGKKQTFFQLSIQELKTIRHWAEKNRESSDKRLLPIAIFFGFIGLFTDWTKFEKFLDWFGPWLIDSIWLTKTKGTFVENSISMTVALLILLIIGFFILMISDLIKNIVSQSLIIEACIIMEHSLNSQVKEIKRPISFYKRLLIKIFKN